MLGLTTSQMLERRLQTIFQKCNLANSIHHARVLIFQGLIVVGKSMVNIPSFMVRVQSEKDIQRSVKFFYKTGRIGSKALKTIGSFDSEPTMICDLDSSRASPVGTRDTPELVVAKNFARE